MNMISTGSFLTETSASTKQSELVKNKGHAVAIGSYRTIAKCVMFVVTPH